MHNIDQCLIFNANISNERGSFAKIPLLPFPRTMTFARPKFLTCIMQDLNEQSLSNKHGQKGPLFDEGMISVPCAFSKNIFFQALCFQPGWRYQPVNVPVPELCHCVDSICAWYPPSRIELFTFVIHMRSEPIDCILTPYDI